MGTGTNVYMDVCISIAKHGMVDGECREIMYLVLVSILERYGF